MSERDFWRLQAHVTGRQSADRLEKCELITLAESCQPSVQDGELREEWMREFAIPLIRELGVRLERSSESAEAGYVSDLVAAGVAMRAKQKAYFSARSQGRLRDARAAERKFDALLSQRSQLQLFAEVV